MDALKFHDIVSRARLNDSSARYVLRHPEYLRDMPTAGKQGMHRLFTSRQAYRFTLCTVLLMNGIPLKVAGRVVDLCDKITGGARRGPPGMPIGWTLEIRDGEYLAMRGGRGRIPARRELFYSIPDGHKVTLPVPTAFQVHIDLGRLRQRLFFPHEGAA